MESHPFPVPPFRFRLFRSRSKLCGKLPGLIDYRLQVLIRGNSVEKVSMQDDDDDVEKDDTPGDGDASI
ncbi:unnamed protein product [Ixodes persulcatus]